MEHLTIKDEYPPNYEFIKGYFDIETFKPVFAYGKIIYNPFKHDIPVDLELHEAVHARQQESYPSPEIWWNKYCIDSDFREKEEIEAYGEQYRFLKKVLLEKGYREALSEFAARLSSPMYKLNISKGRAEKFIKKHANQIK